MRILPKQIFKVETVEEAMNSDEFTYVDAFAECREWIWNVKWWFKVCGCTTNTNDWDEAAATIKEKFQIVTYNRISQITALFPRSDERCNGNAMEFREDEGMVLHICTDWPLHPISVAIHFNTMEQQVCRSHNSHIVHTLCKYWRI